MNFALITASRFVSNAQLEFWAPAHQATLAALAAVWDDALASLRGAGARVAGSTVRVAARVADLRDDEVPILYAETIPAEASAAGDVAYHTLMGGGLPYGVVLADEFSALATAPLTLAADHEIAETAVDPLADQWVSLAGLEGAIALECCDPVQELTIARKALNGASVACSAFVGPAWFRIGGEAGRTYWSDKDAGPLAPGFVADGGYKMTKGGEPQPTASNLPPGYASVSYWPPGYAPPPHKDHPHGRAQRRLRALSLARARGPQ